jgi:hypothetical protein
VQSSSVSVERTFSSGTDLVTAIDIVWVGK